ncbi:hypothetical protein SAMN05421867_102311 [Cellulomonas marina]|uniref:Uncharacterized protein n=1 Tax=Cellulomonas marina TaxID=988821 RepID=A0A1I0WAC9_9CELL|nr:hypothetical protein SAMN05421867_102311 [Cellulomonas marina]
MYADNRTRFAPVEDGATFRGDPAAVTNPQTVTGRPPLTR